MKLYKIICLIFFINIFVVYPDDIVDINKTLSFDMTNKQVYSYYEFLNKFIDTESNHIYLNKEDLSKEEFDKIIREREDENNYFENSLEIESILGTGYLFSETPINPEGYVNYNNYAFRKSHILWYSFVDNWNNVVNPLTSHTGYIITEKDIDVYDYITREKRALVKKGSVLKINGVNLDNSVFIDFNLAFQGCIYITDISLFKDLLSNVKYEIRDNKVYRLLEGNESIINVNIMQTDDGRYYARNDNSGDITGGFYYWEYKCDYFFNKNGIFLEYGFAGNYGL